MTADEYMEQSNNLNKKIEIFRGVTDEYLENSHPKVNGNAIDGVLKAMDKLCFN